MRNQRRFSIEFKSQVIHDLLSGESSPAQRRPCWSYQYSSKGNCQLAYRLALSTGDEGRDKPPALAGGG